MSAGEARVKRNWRPVPFTDVSIDDAFWAPRIRTNREKTLPYEYAQCKETGRIDAFRLDWKPGKEPKPHFYWDSDVAKWVEAASYSLAAHPDPELERKLDEVVDLIVSAQQPDGYLNVYFTVVEPEQRWKDLAVKHELYCAGHLIEAAVAHYEATGRTKLLDAVKRYADYIAEVFGPGEGQIRGYCGHEEIELALVKLYRTTGEERYLRLAQFFVEERGREPNYFLAEMERNGGDRRNLNLESLQAHKPVREQTEAVGHAVRAMYLYSAMTDLAGELGDATLLGACETLWRNVVGKKMYVTGGIGSSRHNEGFTADYDLPNETAYAESCAAVGFVLWNHRLLQLDCDGRYADLMERTLYNGVLSGVSLDGERFFYDNPLASSGAHRRKPWFDCACCPPNIARLLASLGGYVCSANDDGIAVHLYVQGDAKVPLAGQTVALEQRHNYPWDGHIAVTVRPERPAEFALRLRVPGWCRQASLRIGGETVPLTGGQPPDGIAFERGYAVIRREWRPGDTVELELAMPVERIYAHPRVQANIGRVALQRGPLVYCIEQADNGPRLEELLLPADSGLSARFEPGLLGGIAVVEGEALRLSDSGRDGELYRFGNGRGGGSRHTPAETVSVPLRAVPYAFWDNRQGGEMLVWIREYRP